MSITEYKKEDTRICAASYKSVYNPAKPTAARAQ